MSPLWSWPWSKTKESWHEHGDSTQHRSDLRGLALAAWGIAVIRAEMARWRRDDNHT